MQPVGGFAEPMPGPSQDHLDSVIQIDLQHLDQRHRPRLPIDQSHRVDGEGVFELGQLVQLREQRIRVDAVLDLDDQPGAMLQISEILDVGDAGELLAGDQILDLFHDLFRADPIRQRRDHDAFAAGTDLVDPAGRTQLERAASRRIGVAHPVQSDDGPAGREVRPRNVTHQCVQIGIGVSQQMLQRADDLDQIVRGQVGGHPDRDAGCAVDQQIREGGRQDGRFEFFAVVVRPEIHGVGFDIGDHRHGSGCQTAFGVPVGRRAGVQRTEVAVPVDRRQPHRPVLAEPHQGVVDRRVAVRMEQTHDLADNPRTLDMWLVRTQPHVIHGVKNAALNRLQAVPGVRERPGIDDRIGILEVAGLHLG